MTMVGMPSRYTRTAIALHWIIALLILAAFPLGAYMHELPLSPTKLRLYSWHKWLGMTVLLLVVLRMLWRAGHRPPPLPAAVPRWQQTAAAGVHQALYVLMFAVPLAGWLMSSALGFQVVWFGVLPLPDLVARNKEVGEVLKEVHEGLNFALAALVLVHLAAAIKHQWADRDGTLARMVPFLKEKP